MKNLLFVFSFLFIANASLAQQYLYFEIYLTGDGPCSYQPISNQVYFEFADSVDLDKALKNDSILAIELNQAKKIDCVPMDFFMNERNSTEEDLKTFSKEVKNKKPLNQLIRKEIWGNFSVKIYRFPYTISYKSQKWGHPVRTFSAEFAKGKIRFKLIQTKIKHYVVRFN